MRLKPIEQQVIVVVGCTSGIGLETAKRFARKGARQLVLVGRGQADLARTLDNVRAEGGDGITVEADVSDFGQVENVVRRAVDTYGRIDTWAHIAGIPYYSRFEDMQVDEYRRVIDVNLHGPTYGMMAALPALKREGRGAIVVVTSVDAKVPVPYQAAYVAAKHGVLGMIDTLRIELKNEGIPISITNVAPASVNTPFFEKAKTRTGFEPNAMPPIYDPASVADAIVYAASHPVNNINVGSMSLMFQLSRRLSPRMSDATIRNVAFRPQESNIPKGPEAPNNMYNHMEGFHRVEGKFPERYSRATWLKLHPALRSALFGLLLVGVPVGTVLYMRSRRKSKVKGLIDNIGDLAVISAVAGFVTNLLPRKKTLRQRMMSRAGDAVSRAGEMIPPNVGPFRRQTMPEKFMSKVGDIMPSFILPTRKSLPRRAADRVMEMRPVRMLRPRKSLPQRAIQRLGEIIPPSDPFNEDGMMSERMKTEKMRVERRLKNERMRAERKLMAERAKAEKMAKRNGETIRDAIKETADVVRRG